MTYAARQPRTPITNIAWRAGIGAVLGLTLCACSSLPQRIDTLEQARTQVQTLEQDPMARQAAGDALDAARREISAADSAYDAKKDLAVIQHDAYMAKQHAAIAAQRIDEAHAQQQLAQSQKERDQIRLQAREREARRAQAQAQLAQAKAQRAQAKAQTLEQELEALKAKRTDQGLVLTLGDVLFDTDKAVLKPGATPTINRLAAFLQDHPQRRVLVEGYADSRGSQGYNLALSQRRADAVGEALEQEGLAATRVRMEGLGEAYPVASNDTAAGRQQNRRVEIVISDANGRFSDVVQDRLAQVRVQQESLSGG